MFDARRDEDWGEGLLQKMQGVANEKWAAFENPGCLGYIGGYTTLLFRDYNDRYKL